MQVINDHISIRSGNNIPSHTQNKRRGRRKSYRNNILLKYVYVRRNAPLQRFESTKKNCQN
ncbi:hypothetical protein OIU78_018728 [Salix suchowensis]|nr:hypothetical protein OIU78_018728 [Salix suchowensis]